METLHSFEQPEAPGIVLKNTAGQYSLWPALIPVPAGWQPVYGPQPREKCLLWLESHWPDIRPTTTPHTGCHYV